MVFDGDLSTEDFHLISSCPCWAYTRPARGTKKPPLRSGFSAPAGGVSYPIMNESKYITVDLEIKKRGPFDELCKKFDEWGSIAEYLSYSKISQVVWFANIDSPKPLKNPDVCINKFCIFIQSLRGEAKKQWNSSFHKILISAMMFLTSIGHFSLVCPQKPFN